MGRSKSTKLQAAKEVMSSIVFVAPALLIFIIVIAYPTISGLYYSVTDWSGSSVQINFIGLKNFKRLFSDEVFFIAIKNTLFITIIIVVLQNVVALFLATTLNRKRFPRKNIFRVLFFLPSLLSIIVVGYAWMNILNVNMGFLSYLLKLLHVKNIYVFDVFVQPRAALLTICFVFIWQFSGYSMIIYLSGLQAIPVELYESCYMDGANPRQIFFRVTLPLLMPAVTINVFLNLTGCLKAFEQVYVLTGGGPGNSTETVGTFIYNTAFSGYQMGYGAAISTVLFVFIMLISTLQLRLFRSREVEL
jgi:raffinose/stachyose/melibiose transport system permease protein